MVLRKRSSTPLTGSESADEVDVAAFSRPDESEAGDDPDGATDSTVSQTQLGSDEPSSDAPGEDQVEDEEEYIEVRTRPLGSRSRAERDAASTPAPAVQPSPQRNGWGLPWADTPSPVAPLGTAQPASVPTASSDVAAISTRSRAALAVDVPPEIATQLEDGESVLGLVSGEWNSRVVATDKRVVAYSSNGKERLHDVPYDHIASIEFVPSTLGAWAPPAVLGAVGVLAWGWTGWVWLGAVLLVMALAWGSLVRGSKAYVKSAGGDVITLSDAASASVQEFLNVVRSHRVLHA